MKALRILPRLLRIQFVLMRYRLDAIILSIPWLMPFRFLGYLNPWCWLDTSSQSRGERIKRALEELGPLFIKAGQIMSTRFDMLPQDILQALGQLRDQAAPFPGHEARRIIEQALQQPIEQAFASFTEQAIASASIAQVHAASLHDGRHVVIKVLRPKIKKKINADLAVLEVIARLLEKYWRKSHAFKPVAMLQEIRMHLENELDLDKEAANASQLKRNLSACDQVYIPEIYWDYCHNTILVMERIHGIPIADIERLNQHKLCTKQLASRLLESFFTQVFRDRFFHGDLHPGNIFVNPDNPKQPTLIFVDFGAAGALNEHDQRYIAENMLAFFKRDYRRVAQLHIECAWVPAHVNVDQFEAAIRTVCEPIFDRPIKDISFGKVMVKLVHAAHQFDMVLQPQLILLQRNLLNVEGLCRRLDPDLNIWQTVEPIVKHWLKDQFSVKSYLKKIKHYAPLWLEQAPELPNKLYQFLDNPPPRHTTPPANPNKKIIRCCLLLFLLAMVSSALSVVPLWATEALLLTGALLLMVTF